jgi:hypothetical protein
MEKKRNLWVIPTDKPSRLTKNNLGKFIKLNSLQHQEVNENQHIYITSDEEIKEGDWIFDLDVKKVLKADNLKVTTSKKYQCWYYKKIMLTTDQDLINNGVQAINNEFLEWFVKNPSCEEVEVIKEDVEQPKPLYPNGNHKGERVWIETYKIIIPKEEPKQEKYWIGVVKWNDGTILRTQPFYKYDEGIKVWSSKFSYENQGKFEWIDYENFEKPKPEYSKIKEGLKKSIEGKEHFIQHFKNGGTVEDFKPLETLEEAKQRAANYMSLKGALEPKQETPESMIQEIATHLGKTIPETLEHIEKFSKDLDKLKKEPKQEQDDSYIKEQKERRKKLLNLINKLEEENKFMKTELEEAAEKYAEMYRCPATNDNEYCKHDIISAINFGAKWQQKNSYSDKEVIELLQKALTHKDNGETGNLITAQGEIRTANFYSWFEQFKKK